MESHRPIFLCELRMSKSAGQWDNLVFSQVIPIGLSLVETGKVPDLLIRWVIRRLCASRIRELDTKDIESTYQYIQVTCYSDSSNMLNES